MGMNKRISNETQARVFVADVLGHDVPKIEKREKRFEIIAAKTLNTMYSRSSVKRALKRAARLARSGIETYVWDRMTGQLVTQQEAR